MREKVFASITTSCKFDGMRRMLAKPTPQRQGYVDAPVEENSMHDFFAGARGMRGVCMVIATTMLAMPEPSSAQADLYAGEVPFLTLRNLTEADEPGELFGDERSAMSAGRCHVRELDLQGLSSLADAAPSFIREEFLSVENIELSDPADILGSWPRGADTPAPALYVHGYYIGFEKGCRRAALLQQNANIEGRFLWFSWPSDGSLAYYTHDEADLYWSVPDIADAIIELEARFGGGVIDVVGHSLGARGVVLALYDVASRAPETRIDEVVLLAPDMDFGIFERMLPRIRPIADNITVYVNAGDRPLVSYPPKFGH
ncbi:alpha/beta hydrolase [Maritalea mobilis]|uniref:alpha/beta hydrolase n=1 Tax=Maritalea mobilis TaxID=483324 RepID=UPI001C96291A|nr:alpha/beta hydrolase [Maritalea mobilis]MBY6201027.1 alpha/beta hydrolase [Maritalea mobilis]